MPRTTLVQPNHFIFSGKHIHVSYSTSGIDGKPHFSYQDSQHTLSFSGDQIRSVETEVGVIVSVTTRLTIDSGGTTFSLLVPRILVGPGQSASIHTIGISTLHRFSILPMPSQQDSYSTVKLKGHAERVEF